MYRSGLLLLALGMFLWCGCGQDGAVSPHEALSLGLAEPAYEAWAVHDEDGVLVDSGMNITPFESPRELRRLRQPLETTSRTSLHPALEDALENAPDDEVISVIVSVQSAHKLSYLPRFDRTQDPDSATNLEVHQQRLLLQTADDELRSMERLPVVKAIEVLGGEVTEQFRVGNAVVATLSIEALRKLLDERGDIIAASPVETGEAPAAYYDIDDGRDRQKSDLLESAGYDGSGYRVGLMDTGVYASHTVFTSPDPINYWRDCVWTVYSSCTYYPVYPWSVYYDPDDPVTSGGHGTGMADILVGNSDLGDAYRGVAPDALVDSTNVYNGVLHNSLDQTGVLRAFNLLDGVDDVIVANIVANQGYSSTISLAADDVYDEGVAVIAPVGNVSASYSHSPANAHKVMGIGAYYTSTGNDYTGQSGGVNGDSRFKPDVTAPTSIRVASNSGSTSVVQRSGTCPAAAFAGGAAVLLRDYFDYRGWSSDPGLVYTGLITFGDEGGSSLDNTDGAGNLEIGEVSNSTWLSGVKYLNKGQYSDISFYVGSNSCDLRAGIWWAEDYDQSHAKLYLYLYQGSTFRAYSSHINSVFQKVVYPSTMGTGWWKIRVYSSSSSPNRSQKVHYLIHYRKNC